ncbi:MAG: nocobactin polyketide synthase NbtC [Mycobacteriaceae bacterium]
MSDYYLPDNTIPVLLSSNTQDGLKIEASTLLKYLESNVNITVSQVASMIFRTRLSRQYRVLVMAVTRHQLMEALSAVVRGENHAVVVNGRARRRKVGFVFPGQGSQRPGMGDLYYQLSPAYRSEIDACTQIHELRFGDSKPFHYLLGHEGQYDGALSEVQPALMFHMIALAAMWKAAGVTPHATIGHSQGELAAAVVAKVMTRHDAVLAVAHRARLIEKYSPQGYSMAILGIDRDSCENLLARSSGWAELSVINSPHIIAISGEQNAIIEIVASAQERGQFAKQIAVSYPAHTSFVSSVREKLENALHNEMSSSTFLESDINCYGSTLGEPMTSNFTHDQYWYWNLRNRVRFDKAIVSASAEIDTFVEICDHPIMQLAIQDNLLALSRDDCEVISTSVRTAKDLSEFTQNLAIMAVSDSHFQWSSLKITNSEVENLPLLDFPHTYLDQKRCWALLSPDYRVEIVDKFVKPIRLTEEWKFLSRKTLSKPRKFYITNFDLSCSESDDQLTGVPKKYGWKMVDLVDADTLVIALQSGGASDPIVAVDEFAKFVQFIENLFPLRPNIRECWLVTSGAEIVLDADTPTLSQGAISAFFRCLALENLGIRFCHLDLPKGENFGLSQDVIDALHTAQEPVLALRNGKQFAKRLHKPVPEVKVHVDLTEVIILGGTGHVGLEFCEQLAKDGAERITLVSRTGDSARIASRIDQLRSTYETIIRIVACDISDFSSVKKFAECLSDSTVTLLVHAAVDYVYEQSDLVSTTRAAAAKIIGLSHILDLIEIGDECRILFCSSFVATLGGIGQGIYAGTNRMLDLFARELSARSYSCKSVQWGLWVLPAQVDATVVARIEGAGLLEMPAREAIDLGLYTGSSNCIILSADLSKMQSVVELSGLSPVFSPVFEAELPSRIIDVQPASNEYTPVAATNGEELFHVLKKELNHVMGKSPSDSLDTSIALVALGLDSLQALELRKRVKSTLHRDLPVNAILGGASFDDVVQLISENKGS